MNKKKYIYFVCTIVSITCILLSCSNPKATKQSANSQEAISDTVSYIKIADTDSIRKDWSKENTLVFHWTSEPDNLHPTNGNSGNKRFIENFTQMFLIATDLENLKPKPELVKTLPQISADELQFTYELREEPTWDNGDPLSIEDVLFSFKAAKCPLTNNPHAKPFLENLKDLITDPKNPRKFTLIMKRKYIQNITFFDCPILQRKFFDKKNTLSKYTLSQFDDPKFKTDLYKDLNEWATEFNNPQNGRLPEKIQGLGSYKITSWDAGQTIVLTKKQNHWTSKLTEKSINETSYPDKIIFKLNTDENSQMLEFKTQTIDVSTWLSTKTLLELQKDENFNKNYNSRFVQSFDYSYIGMNMKPDGVIHKKIFTDKKVRRAMALLTPIDDIINVVYKGMGTRIVSFVSPLRKKDYNTDLTLLTLDIEKAKRLLDEAGWKDTDGDNIRDKLIDGEKVNFSFNISYMNSSTFVKDIVLMIQESMYKAGIKIIPTPLEFAVFYENAKKHNFDMMMGAWSGSGSDNEDYTQVWHTNSWATQGSNFTGFGNAESDALIDSIKYTLNDSVRHPLIKKLQSIVYDEQPYIFVSSGVRKIVIHKRFANGNMYFERPNVLLNNLKLITK